MPANLRPALELARTRFAGLDPARAAAGAAASWRPAESAIYLDSLGETCAIRYPSGEVELAGGAPDDTFQILVLHYLSQTGGTPLENYWISFKEIPGAAIYSAPFQQRCLVPLLKYFGARPALLPAAARPLQGKQGNAGEVSAVLYPLPLLPVCFVLWAGDDEFPPSGNVLFDASVASHLPVEDCVHLTSYVLNRLIAARVEANV